MSLERHISVVALESPLRTPPLPSAFLPSFHPPFPSPTNSPSLSVCSIALSPSSFSFRLSLYLSLFLSLFAFLRKGLPALAWLGMHHAVCRLTLSLEGGGVEGSWQFQSPSPIYSSNPTIHLLLIHLLPASVAI